MKLYRHYKNKFYRYFGIAKHSETLEDLVYYECLYPNEAGQFWVRPKELFHGEIEIEGKKRRRFAPVAIDIEAIHEITPFHLGSIQPIVKQGLRPMTGEMLQDKIRTQTSHLLLIASIEHKVVGFKWGYKKSSEVFYSWLGAVLPEFRGLGVAQAMMSHQHQLCSEMGFRKIRTKTVFDNSPMLILNLKNKFFITDVEKSEKPTKIVLEKSIA